MAQALIKNKNILNLSSCIKMPNTIDYNKFKFSGGENHIAIKDVNKVKGINEMVITSSIKSSDDLMYTLMATDAIKHINNDIKIKLFCPYTPYARQDRLMKLGEPLSMKVFADIINQQGYRQVTIFDPHSDVSTALIDRVQALNNYNFVEFAFRKITGLAGDQIYYATSDICLVSPDLGAYKKIVKLADKLDFVDKKNIITNIKIRDTDNGKIIKSELIGNVKNKICFIVDDIIDGGATFLQLAKDLKEGGALSVHLIVSHGIFSKGYDKLFDDIDSIYTTDSFYDVDNVGKHDQVHTLNLFNLYKEYL